MIRAHVASAPFSIRLVSVPVALRGQTFQGVQLEGKLPNDFLHLAKRILVEQQWGQGTTLDEYAVDLRSAILSEYSAIVFYNDQNENYIGFFKYSPLPPSRRGLAFRNFVYVVYTATWGAIKSGYQVTVKANFRVEENPLWIK